jgi:hypothetical protein
VLANVISRRTASSGSSEVALDALLAPGALRSRALLRQHLLRPRTTGWQSCRQIADAAMAIVFSTAFRRPRQTARRDPQRGDGRSPSSIRPDGESRRGCPLGSPRGCARPTRLDEANRAVRCAERQACWHHRVQPETADIIDIAATRIVYHVGRKIFLLDGVTGKTSLLAVSHEPPVGLSIDGRRVAWAENVRIRAITLPD